MTSCCWLVVMDSERFASPIEGIFCGGLNAYCMHIRPLFLRTSGSSGVLKALSLERNGQLSCNPKKKKKQPAQQPRQLPSDRAANNDTMDVLGDPGDPPQLTEWRRLWQLASAAYFNRQHRVLWWRILHGCVMCGAFSAYIGRATPQQACCPFACCCTPTQPQTVSHMFLECPVAATVVSWLCRLWQAMTGHAPDASVASILVASTPDGHCASNALLQTWHRLRLAVLHSIWTAARITASSTQGLAPTHASPSPFILT